MNIEHTTESPKELAAWLAAVGGCDAWDGRQSFFKAETCDCGQRCQGANPVTVAEPWRAKAVAAAREWIRLPSAPELYADDNGGYCCDFCS